MIPYKDFVAGLNDREKEIVGEYERVIISERQTLETERPLRVLEVGSGWGIFSRTCLEFGSSKVELTTIDKRDPKVMIDFNRSTDGFEFRFERITADSLVFLPAKVGSWDGYFDLVFVDGDHGYEATLSDMSHGWRFLAPGGMLMVDDVFHKYNWIMEEREGKDFNFGVTRAMWDFLRVRGEPATIKCVGQGVVCIHKLHESGS